MCFIILNVYQVLSFDNVFLNFKLAPPAVQFSESLNSPLEALITEVEVTLANGPTDRIMSLVPNALDDVILGLTFLKAFKAVISIADLSTTLDNPFKHYSVANRPTSQERLSEQSGARTYSKCNHRAMPVWSLPLHSPSTTLKEEERYCDEKREAIASHTDDNSILENENREKAKDPSILIGETGSKKELIDVSEKDIENVFRLYSTQWNELNSSEINYLKSFINSYAKTMTVWKSYDDDVILGPFVVVPIDCDPPNKVADQHEYSRLATRVIMTMRRSAIIVMRSCDRCDSKSSVKLVVDGNELHADAAVVFAKIPVC
ncbi:hypothetical protein GQX74_011494 [Glossina fuscipes]|nr:hypothetical protein GQX74_011494 [Glossina fuscipes]